MFFVGLPGRASCFGRMVGGLVADWPKLGSGTGMTRADGLSANAAECARQPCMCACVLVFLCYIVLDELWDLHALRCHSGDFGHFLL